MQEVHEPVAELIMANTPISVEDWDRPLFGTWIDHALYPGLATGFLFFC